MEDLDEGSSRGNFMRARILLDVDQPLCRGSAVGLAMVIETVLCGSKVERL